MRHTFFATLAVSLVLATSAMALAPTASPRPDMRPIAGIANVTLSSQGSPLAVSRSLRPMIRGLRAAPASDVRLSAAALGFADWKHGFRDKALAQGIRPDTFDTAFSGVTVINRVINNDNTQAEFSRSLADYLDGAVSDARINNGQTAFARHRDALTQIERRYGVDAEVVAAIWGLESAYGALRGKTEIISAMATLAYEGRRRDFFEAELIAAMRILEAGDITARQMTGSWAGAMGHTQFMPTSYLAYAVDFDGDGRRDIWSDNPVDALASTAAYLREHGWVTGQPWGVEVVLPPSFDYTLAGKHTKRGAVFWRRQGVRLADGGQIPDHGQAAILLPAGHRGAALMIFDNFHVIARYNASDAYVIGIGHLADRIAGGAPFRATWPRDARGLSRAERQELQRQLAARGLLSGTVDGIIGSQTADALRQFQTSVGLVPDGFASVDVLEQLRR